MPTTAEFTPRILPGSSPAIARVLPIPLSEFFGSHFNRSPLRLNHTDTKLDIDAIWRRDKDFADNLAHLAADGKLHGKLSSAVAVHGSDKQSFRLPVTQPSVASAARLFDTALSSGMSFTLKFEYLSPAYRPFKWLSDALFNVTGIPASIHLYCSAAGAKVLNPHTDPYDVLVWQLHGSKAWRACVPRFDPEATQYSESAKLSLTDAQRCLLQELARDSIQGCTQYTVDDTHSLRCEDFTMAPGDVLYMPKGVVHYAVTSPDAESFHLTVGLHRDNLQWLDVLYQLLSSPEQQGLDGTQQGQSRVPLELMQIYAETGEGVHLHEVVPGWLLRCRRPWHRQRARAHGRLEWRPAVSEGPSSTTAPSAEPDAATCEANDAELRRLLGLHVHRFSDWARRQISGGLWKLASALADREKPVGDAPDVQAVEHLFWWGGDLTFLKQLIPDETRFAQAFDWVADVVDYADTVSPRWRRRQKGRQRARRRRYGEPSPLGSPPTLCDELAGWESECQGSDADHCEVRVTRTTTCEAWCAAQGAWCEAAWDDEDGGCKRQASPIRGARCSERRSSQICRCRRDCADEGPWKCVEEGCPSRVVNCTVLSAACKARFGAIWRKPPPGMTDLTVAQACPQSCGKCTCSTSEDEQQQDHVGRTVGSGTGWGTRVILRSGCAPEGA